MVTVGDHERGWEKALFLGLRKFTAQLITKCWTSLLEFTCSPGHREVFSGFSEPHKQSRLAVSESRTPSASDPNMELLGGVGGAQTGTFLS